MVVFPQIMVNFWFSWLQFLKRWSSFAFMNCIWNTVSPMFPRNVLFPHSGWPNWCKQLLTWYRGRNILVGLGDCRAVGQYCYRWWGKGEGLFQRMEEIYWLGWVTTGRSATTATGGEARVEGCSKPMEASKGGCSWKSNYYWLRKLLSPPFTFSNSDWPNTLKPSFIADIFSSILLLNHSNEPILYPEDGGSTFLRSTMTFKFHSVLPCQITKP